MTIPAAIATPAPPAPAQTRRALVFLAISVLFALAALAALLINPSSQAAAPCALGSQIAQAALSAGSGGTPELFAVVRPPPQANTALGNEPGCDALYRSDDNGVTWTVSFSATAEAPLALASTGTGELYLLTQRVRFPLYVAGNLYRSNALGSPWTWQRISPQDRRAVPAVSITNVYQGLDRSLLLRATNGDGAALVRSIDRGDHWQAVVVPNLLSAGSVAMLDNTLVVAPPSYSRGQSPGLISSDGGRSWAPLGMLPGSNRGIGLHVRLSAGEAEGALVLELVPGGVATDGQAAARFASYDLGRTWSRVQCGNLPAPGCAPAARWAWTTSARYVLYHRHIFRAVPGQAWRQLPITLPIPSADVLQLLAASGRPSDRIYLAGANGLWEWSGSAWKNRAAALGLGGPPPQEG